MNKEEKIVFRIIFELLKHYQKFLDYPLNKNIRQNTKKFQHLIEPRKS